MEALYNRAERWLGNRTTAFDRRLAQAAPAARAAMLADWRAQAQRHLGHMALLSANGRTFAILIACLAGSPVWFWLWELLALSVLALAKGRSLAQLEARMASGAAPAASAAGRARMP